MKISSSRKFLFFTYDDANTAYDLSISVHHDIEELLPKWEANSRMSPIWRLEDDQLPDTSPDIHGDGYLFFVSALNPVEVEISLLSLVADQLTSLRVLCSLGIFNVLFSVRTLKEAKIIRKILLGGTRNFEEWKLTDGQCAKMDIHRNDVPSAYDEFELASVKSDDRKLDAKHLELKTNVLAAASRGSLHFTWVVSDLKKVLDDYGGALEDIQTASDSDRHFYLDEAYYRVINANSAISRFTSQALSGIQPIDMCESHYWPHSALGIGMASTAARNVAAKIAERFTAFDFVGRLQLLDGKEYALKSRPADLKQSTMNKDYLLDAPTEPLSPTNPICFYSGRDSFKHDVYSLSLPLESVDLATSFEWSLRTMTHEMTHKLMEPVLGLLLPESKDDFFHPEKGSKVSARYIPDDLLEAAKLGLLDTLLAYARSQDSEFIDKINADETQYDQLYEFVILFSDHVEEFLVHTFDYLYFYDRKPADYVKSLWLSWGIIPHLESKLDDYIVRTISALSANTMRRDDAINVARGQFKDNFKVDVIKKNNPHFETVLGRVESEEYWNSKLRPEVEAGNLAARFVLTFLYSRSAHKEIFADPALEPGDKYAISRREFATQKYVNPLRMLRELSGIRNGTPSDSLWLFHALTFNVVDI